MLAGFMAYLLGESWAMEPLRLEGLLKSFSKADIAIPGNISVIPHAQGFFDGDSNRSRMTVNSGVATIPITGVLMKSVPSIFRFFGIDATSYTEISADVARANADPNVSSIMLAVDSPGGQAGGVEEAAAAIKASGKPVASAISGIGASAAYWLASQARPITASKNALVGSIGAMTVQVDSSEAAAKDGLKVHVIASGPLKGAFVPGAKITDEHLAAAQELIDGLGANFVAAVASGRGVPVEKAKAWASGKLWIADEAARLGLIDAVGKAHSGINGGVVLSGRGVMMMDNSVWNFDLDKERLMDEQKMEAERQKASADAITTERKRTAEIKAAFPSDPAHALACIEKGLSLLESKAAYADVLTVAAIADRKALLEAESKLAAAKTGATGAKPITAGADPAASDGKGFMEVATSYMRENKVSMVEAMSHIARTRPQLHADFVDGQYDRRREVHERKKALGMA